MLLGLLLLVGCSTWVVMRFDWGSVWTELKNVSWPFFLFGSGICTLAYWLFRTFRWRIFLRNAGLNGRFSTLYFYTIICLSLSIVTPMQSGEALKIELLKHYDPTLSRVNGYAGFAVERILDLLVILFLAVLSLWLYPEWLKNLPIQRAWIILASLLLLAAAICVMWVLIKKWRRIFGMSWPNVLLQAGGHTCAGWLCTAAAWYCCLLAAGIDIGITPIVGLMSVNTLVSVASAIPGAVGIAELTTATLLEQLGLTAEMAQFGAIVLRVYGIWILLLGSFCTLIFTIRKRYVKKM